MIGDDDEWDSVEYRGMQRAAQHDDDDEDSDLPSPSVALDGVPLDSAEIEAERKHQKKRDKIVAPKISADDPARDEKARQRKSRIDAENRSKAAVGAAGKNTPRPDPTAPDYSTPIAPTRPTIVKAAIRRLPRWSRSALAWDE